MRQTARDLKDERLRRACESAVLEVLELMFFEVPAGEAQIADGCQPGCLGASAGFGGSLQGSMTVAVSGPLADRLTAAMLGMDDSGPQPDQQGMLAELTNMICGATMSRIEPEGRLRIGTPVPVHPAAGESGEAPEAWLCFALEEGSLAVTVRYEEEG